MGVHAELWGIETTAQQLAEEAIRAVPVTVATVALLERPSRSLTIKAVRTLHDLPLPVSVGTRLQLRGAPWQERVFEHREPVRLERDAAGAPMLGEELDLPLVPGLRSVCLVPILFGDEIVGILALGEMRSPARAPMSAETQQRCVGVVEEFVTASAAAWEAVRLRRQVRAMSLLVETVRQLLETRSDADVLTCLGTRIGDWLGVPVRGVLLRVGSRAGADVVATWCLPEGEIDHAQLLLAMARVESRRGPVSATRVADDPLDPLHGASLEGETWTRVGLPLLHGDRLLGVVCLYVGEDLYPAAWELEVFRWLGEAAAASLRLVSTLEEERSEREWLRTAAWELSTTHHHLILGGALDGVVRLVGSFLPERLVQAHRTSASPGLDEATWRRVGEVAASEIAGLLADVRAATQIANPAKLPVDVNSLIRRSVEMARARWLPRAREQGVELRLEFTPAPEPILIESGEGLLAALVQGIENALEAVPGGGLVRVSADRENGQVVISVVDTGPGVPDELRHQAFVPFLSTKGKLGLGLSVVRSVVVRHGGEATLATHAGGGAALTLKLPRG